MSLSVLALIAHAVVLLISIRLCVYILLSGRKSVLAIVVFVFIAFDSFGLLFVPYIPIESFLPYIQDQFFLINQADENLYLRQVLAHWVFLFIADSILLLELGWARKKPISCSMQTTFFSQVALISLITFSLFAYYKYFIQGPGLELLITTRLNFSSTSDAIVARSIVRDTVNFGQGAFMASVASIVALPLVAALLIRLRVRRLPWWLFICFVLSLPYVYQTRQKAPLLATLLTYVFLLVVYSGHLKKWMRHGKHAKTPLPLKRLSLATAIFGFIGGTIYYSVNFGLSLPLSMISVVGRLFTVPVATECNWFAVFPDIFDFRGLLHIFRIPLRDAMGLSGVTIYDVAGAATGNVFSANASFIAVGWSGGGYLGVALAALTLIAGLFLVDWLLQICKYETYLLIIGLSVSSLLAVVSGGLADYVGLGGVVVPLGFVMLERSSQGRFMRKYRTFRARAY